VSIFDGIEHKAGAQGRGTDITPGVYDFETLAVEDGVTTFTKSKFFKVKVKVLASSGEPSKKRDGTDVNPLPVGAESEIFVTPDQYGYYVTEIKELGALLSNGVALALGEKADFTPSSVTEDDLKTLVSTEQPAKGVKIHAVYTVKPGKFTKKEGMPVADKRWSLIPPEAAKTAA
jgi:hypothetical protein